MYFMLIDNLHEKVVYTTTNLRQALDKQNRLALYGVYVVLVSATVVHDK
jgi:hypothetical protein